MGPAVAPCSPVEAARAGRLVLITVSDDAIRGVCGELAGAGALGEGAVVAHCCGALGSEVLAAAREQCGCRVASMHPLQTFPTASAAVGRLPGAFFFCEGDGEALEVVEAFVGCIGGKAVRITASGEAGKQLYHASAVMACNYLSAMIDSAVELMGRAGVDGKTALTALGPLVRATVDNVLAMGPADALTGPIARGDVQTVQRHLAALDAAGALGELPGLYRAAGRQTVALALRKGTIDPPTAARLLGLLAG